MVENNKDSQPGTDATKEIFEDIKDWSGQFLRKVKEEANTLSTKGKLKLDVRSLKKQRGFEFQKLGKKVYLLLEEESYNIPEAEMNRARIEELTKEIEDREKKLSEVGQPPEPGEGASKEEEESDQSGEGL